MVRKMKKVDPFSFVLTKDKKIPYTKFFDMAIHPWNIPRVLKWNFYKDRRGNICLVRKGSKDKLITNQHYARLTVVEWDTWLKSYKLPKKLEISKILDVGSGTGETMFFYDQVYGIKNFIGVEIDSDNVKLNKKNAKEHNWNVKFHNEPFKLEHFKKEDFDFAKIDCEGGERVLVGEEINVPMVVETHTLKLRKEFQGIGFEVLEKVDDEIFIMNNFRELKHKNQKGDSFFSEESWLEG